VLQGKSRARILVIAGFTRIRDAIDSKRRSATRRVASGATPNRAVSREFPRPLAE